jgi:hypothetical protein
MRNAKKLLSDRLAVEIQVVMDQNASRRSTRMPGKKNNPASAETQATRKRIMLQVFGQLWELGYRVRYVQNFAERHVRTLAEHWKEEGLSSSVLANRLSTIRLFCEWIGKPGMVKDTLHYFPNREAARTSIADRRSEERRVGKECRRLCRSRWSPYH